MMTIDNRFGDAACMCGHTLDEHDPNGEQSCRRGECQKDGCKCKKFVAVIEEDFLP